MPECAWHPGTETGVSCPECGRYMCPKDMVDTPVGYKCKECGRMRIKRGGVKPRQVALAVAFGLGAALVLAPLMRFVPFFLIRALLYGALVGEATRRGAGGHRTTLFAAIAAGCAVVGAVVAAPFVGLDVLMILGGAIVAGVWVTSASLFG